MLPSFNGAGSRTTVRIRRLSMGVHTPRISYANQFAIRGESRCTRGSTGQIGRDQFLAKPLGHIGSDPEGTVGAVGGPIDIADLGQTLMHERIVWLTRRPAIPVKLALSGWGDTQISQRGCRCEE